MGPEPDEVEPDEPRGPRASATDDRAVPTLVIGAKVYVRNRFLGNWTAGFEIAEVMDDGYRIRRLSDGHAFPDVFAPDDVHLERREHLSHWVAEFHHDRRH